MLKDNYFRDDQSHILLSPVFKLCLYAIFIFIQPNKWNTPESKPTIWSIKSKVAQSATVFKSFLAYKDANKDTLAWQILFFATVVCYIDLALCYTDCADLVLCYIDRIKPSWKFLRNPGLGSYLSTCFHCTLCLRGQ